MSSRKKQITILIIVIILLVGLIAALLLLPQTTVFFKRAAGNNSSSQMVLANSYIFASPLQAQSGSQEKIRVTVFVLDGRGLGVANRQVSLSSSPSSVKVTSLLPLTDENGKATFDISSSSSGKVSLEAKVDNIPLPQKVSVVFN